MKLVLVSPELVEYFWHGDRYPKLIRRIDGWECDEIAVLDRRLAESIEDKSDPDRRFKLAYCKKRIALIDQEDLINLERAVRQGLAVFYRVGEALAEIRDRQLYKQHGYKDFREYLKEKWNMGKSQAYRLIDSNEVIKNLESVPHGGQKVGRHVRENLLTQNAPSFSLDLTYKSAIGAAAFMWERRVFSGKLPTEKPP